MPISFPFNVDVSCDPVAGADSYEFTLNGAAAGASVSPLLKIPVPSAGTHTFGVTAVSAFDRSAEATKTVQIVSVGQPGNIKIVKG